MAVAPPRQLALEHFTSAGTSPPLLIRLVSAFIFACVILVAWFIFISIVASLTKKVIDRIARFVAKELYSSQTIYPFEQSHRLQQYVVVHMLIDQTCPISSHTPPELPRYDKESAKKILPERLCSPCGMCDKGIGMGQLKRTLPCDHSFHARCIDKVCINKSFRKLSRAKGGFECPLCKFVVVPTPALISEFVPKKLEMIF